MPTPTYTASNCQAAYQLNWSVTAFPKTSLPDRLEWLSDLKTATEPDGVRVLECRAEGSCLQFFISSRPDRSPSAIVASVKGRLQYLVRDRVPRAFRRNYRIDSVGSTKTQTLGSYVGKQTTRHAMVDPRLQQCLERLQFHDPKIDLCQIQASSSGQFVHNLQVVLENSEGWHEWREGILVATRDMIIRSSRAKGFRLSRIGLLSNHVHVHITVGCGITDDPQTVDLGFLNNLAYAQDMRPVFKFSYYVGTFGKFDRQAIRRKLSS